MYKSTRGAANRFSAAEAILAGLAPDGGLLVPEEFPSIGAEALLSLDYQQRATTILKPFLPDYTEDELAECVASAYGGGKFAAPAVAPVVKLCDDLSVLELWHGPTSAFKDMALQLLPRLLSLALKKTNTPQEVAILVATSGDTGKAALEGFRDVTGTRILVFYPNNGVSEIQRLQMVTQEGNNVAVIGVEGNFDDAQTGVKRLFSDQALGGELAGQGFLLSSANSINWGRLVPQIVYYYSAYAELVARGCVKLGQPVNFVVPTGNFGNILAGYYAKHMGLPVNRLICAANRNNVLTDFIRTGVYDRRREFYKTFSPSMDILVSSNLERLLFQVADGDYEQVAGWMSALAGRGEYRVEGALLQRIQRTFWSGWASDGDTQTAIRDVYREQHYLMDPHTAVGYHVYREYLAQTHDDTHTVLVSTASPFKFNACVLSALSDSQILPKSEFAMLRMLSERTNLPVPAPLAALERKEVRHQMVCSKTEMCDIVKRMLKCGGKKNG